MRFVRYQRLGARPNRARRRIELFVDTVSHADRSGGRTGVATIFISLATESAQLLLLLRYETVLDGQACYVGHLRCDSAVA